jgi:hypothetical protein
MRSLIFAASLLLTTPAFATEWIHCASPDDAASVGVLVGGFDFVNITATVMHVGDEDWASNEGYGPGTPIVPSQAYIGDDQIVIDFADEENSETLAELRVYLASEGEDYVQGGVLRVPGRGAWVVSCEGP